MKRKIKYLTTILLFVFLFYSIKTSYSRYNTQVQGSINNNNNNLQFARFVVNNEVTDTLDFKINDMVPGDEKEIDFSVRNYISKGNVSDVNITYKIILTSYMLPLEYELYIEEGGRYIVPFTCTGYLGKVCESAEYTINYSSRNGNWYYLKVKYPSTSPSNSATFKNGIDNIHLEIEAWQKTN